jgi:hypothetical protein
MRDKTQPTLHAALCNINPSLSCCQVELQVLLRSYMRPHYMHIAGCGQLSLGFRSASGQQEDSPSHALMPSAPSSAAAASASSLSLSASSSDSYSLPCSLTTLPST